MIDNIMLGLEVATQPTNIGMAFLGCLFGTLVGVLPGIGPLATMAMLLPITFYVPPESSIIMLAGIYYGAQYGGSTTAILVNMPGETSAAVTCIDGHALAMKGRGGAALTIAALGSFWGGSVAIVAIMAFALPLSTLVLALGPADYFSLMVFGLVGSIFLAKGSLLKAVAMVLMGILFATIGTDPNSGNLRFTFDNQNLFDGLDFTPVAVGLFGVAEIVRNLSAKADDQPTIAQVGPLMPTRRELAESVLPMLRGSVIGSILGVLPGGGALLSSYASYAMEKKLSKTPEAFGKGAIAGVAGPETANNAGAQTSFIPMLTLGLPSNAIMAVMIGALMIQGIAPGPRVIVEYPEIIWGLIISMWVGNLILVILNLPLVGVWVSLLRVPYRILFPSIIMFSLIGVFSVSNSTFNLYVAAFLGGLGYIFAKCECEPAPLVLGMILGGGMEENFRRAMQLADGRVSIFVTEPISVGFLLASVALLVTIALPSVRRGRELAFADE